MDIKNSCYKNQGIHVITAIFTVEKGIPKVLLIKRKNEPFYGEWCLTGGALQNNEDLIDGAKREIYEKYGLYDDSYRIAADYEFMVRFLKDRENRLAYLPKTIIEMYYGGTSTSDLGSYWISLKEGYRALKVNKVHGALWISGIRTCRVLLQFISTKIPENEG